MLRGLALLGAMCFAVGGAVAADVVGTVTILDGDALIVRGAARLRAAEGVRLLQGDIIETGDKAFGQIELVEHTVLEMGPKSKAMLGGPPRYKLDHTVYALTGWFKLTNARQQGNVRAFDLRSPLIEIGLLPGVVTMQLKPAEAVLFAERGDLKLLERPAGTPVGVRQGQTYRRPAGVRGTIMPATPPAFIAEMPRPFRDSLPQRAERFRSRDVPARTAPDFGYADVEPWLGTEPAFRRQFVERWRAKAREPAFRRGLIANLRSHPEWDRVLFPEKYLPRPAASAPAGAIGTATAAATR